MWGLGNKKRKINHPSPCHPYIITDIILVSFFFLFHMLIFYIIIIEIVFLHPSIFLFLHNLCKHHFTYLLYEPPLEQGFSNFLTPRRATPMGHVWVKRGVPSQSSLWRKIQGIILVRANSRGWTCRMCRFRNMQRVVGSAIFTLSVTCVRSHTCAQRDDRKIKDSSSRYGYFILCWLSMFDM